MSALIGNWNISICNDVVELVDELVFQWIGIEVQLICGSGPFCFEQGISCATAGDYGTENADHSNCWQPHDSRRCGRMRLHTAECVPCVLFVLSETEGQSVIQAKLVAEVLSQSGQPSDSALNLFFFFFANILIGLSLYFDEGHQEQVLEVSHLTGTGIQVQPGA